MDKIVTPRLILRTLELNDANDVFEYAKTELVGPAAGWQPHKNIEETKKAINWMMKTNEVWAILHKDDQKVIGTIGLHQKEHLENQREIGYVLNPSYWHNGYMIEAVKALISYSFAHLGITKLHCAHFQENQASQKVIQKAGFKFIKQQNMQMTLYGFQIDKVSYQYELEKSDYERKI